MSLAGKHQAQDGRSLPFTWMLLVLCFLLSSLIIYFFGWSALLWTTIILVGTTVVVNLGSVFMSTRVTPYPDLHRTNSSELPVLAVITGVLGGLLTPRYPRLGTLILLPALLIFLYWLIAGLWNSLLRYRWSRACDGRLSARRLRELVGETPDRYRLHVRHYGGFDVMGLAPAAILEDRIEAKRFAVYPPSSKVIDYCKDKGTTVVDHQDHS